MNDKEKKQIITAVAVIAAVILITLIPRAEQSKAEDMGEKLSEAEELILKGDWDAAYDIAEQVGSKCRDDQRLSGKRSGLMFLIRAERELGRNNAESACTFFALAEEYRSFFCDEVKAMLQKDGDDARAALAAERNKKSSEAPESQSDVPYVGMRERYIGNTKLGSPSETVRHNSEMINGERCRANLYDFFEGKKLIFCARCLKGRVTEVWDYRGKDTDFDPYYNGESRTKYVDVDGYSHVDDFYYDYFEDFYDFEEAEEYYYSHGGK